MLHEILWMVVDGFFWCLGIGLGELLLRSIRTAVRALVLEDEEDEEEEEDDDE